MYVCVCIFQPITQREMTDTEYHVNHDEMIDVTDSTTLTFTPPLLVNVFTDTVDVMVTAVNRYGIGPASEPKSAVIYGK